MIVRKKPEVPSSEITSESVFLKRRQFLQGVGAASLGLATAGTGASPTSPETFPGQAALQPDDELTPENIVTTFNNFYEFGTGKSDPAEHAHTLTTDPWTVKVSGEAAKTGKFDLDQILSGLTAEERIYRFRCVEAWSMVVPWQGIPLRKILEQFEPNGNAKYVELKTLVRPSEMRGQRSLFSSIDWPYVEGLPRRASLIWTRS